MLSVVNCFHFSVSLGYKTTKWFTMTITHRLWIAFIFQYLWDTKQQVGKSILEAACCELLSFFSIFGIQNNFKVKYIIEFLVVNCFHFSVSLGYKTTEYLLFEYETMLWIAFIFQYLWDTKQLKNYYLRTKLCCELLSFFSIFGIQNNILRFQLLTSSVVNCFHFSVSLGYKTTHLQNQFQAQQLWIAFIFQYLWDTKQLYLSKWNTEKGCELLSFFSIFGIQNNLINEISYIFYVVNCFHFSVSLGYKTTFLSQD